MSGKAIILSGPQQRLAARSLVDNAPRGWIVTVRAPTRNTEQSAKFHAMVRDIAVAKPEGRIWIPDIWKRGLMGLLSHKVTFERGLQGTGPFPVGLSTMQLSVEQMSGLIECGYDYGARYGVRWSEVNPYDR